MAFRILRPTTGVISVKPAENYDGVISRYSSEIRVALREEENALITKKVNAFNQGDLTFKDLKKFLDRLATNYPKDSSRYVDIMETVSKARVTDIRLSDLRLSNELLEKMGGGGLTDSESSSMLLQRISNMRGHNAQKWDPESWNSLLTDWATIQDRISSASKVKTESDIRNKIAQLDSQYQATIPFGGLNPITGDQHDRAVIDLYQDLQRDGLLTPADQTAMNELELIMAYRKRKEVTDFVGIDPDTGLEFVKQVHNSILMGNRYKLDHDALGNPIVIDQIVISKTTGQPRIVKTFKPEEEAAAVAYVEELQGGDFSFKDQGGVVRTGNWEQDRPEGQQFATNVGGEGVAGGAVGAATGAGIIYGQSPGLGVAGARPDLTTTTGPGAGLPFGLGGLVSGAVGGLQTFPGPTKPGVTPGPKDIFGPSIPQVPTEAMVSKEPFRGQITPTGGPQPELFQANIPQLGGIGAQPTQFGIAGANIPPATPFTYGPTPGPAKAGALKKAVGGAKIGPAFTPTPAPKGRSFLDWLFGLFGR